MVGLLFRPGRAVKREMFALAFAQFQERLDGLVISEIGSRRPGMHVHQFYAPRQEMARL